MYTYVHLPCGPGVVGHKSDLRFAIHKKRPAAPINPEGVVLRQPRVERMGAAASNRATLGQESSLRQKPRRGGPKTDVPAMSQSIAKVAIHIVFSTKNRKPWLQSQELRDDLFAYMATILGDNVDSPAILIGGVEDHIHALCLLSRKFAIMKVVQEAKTETSKWIKKQSRETRDFSWQGGYGAFSVSGSNIPQVKAYILNQEEYHRRMTFEDEFREICKRHGIEIDERYVWD